MAQLLNPSGKTCFLQKVDVESLTWGGTGLRKEAQFGSLHKKCISMGQDLSCLNLQTFLTQQMVCPRIRNSELVSFSILLLNFLENCLGNKVPGIWKSLWECFWSWDRRAAVLWVSAHLFSEGITLSNCDYMSTSFEILKGYWKEVFTRAILNYKIGTRILHMDLPRYAIL